MPQKDFFSLKDKTALIAGGTDGIGLSVAKRFVKAGAKVIIVGRRDGDSIAQEFGASFIRCDVSVEEEQIAMYDEAERLFGKLDIIINNAGFAVTGSAIEQGDTKELDQSIGVMQKGVYFGLKYAPRHMNDGGSIINTSSLAGVMGIYGYGQYSMTKAAVINLTKTSAIELASRGIRVNAVCPGTVKTAMVPDGDPEIAVVKLMAPLGRIAGTEEVEGLYHFLASDESRYITGQAIMVDGGVSAGLSLNAMVRLMSD
jgi:NAD(P)-dependent dehydrogenase (short-subunit alcohol dehydrogenase family)